jgi:hypothetical protein
MDFQKVLRRSCRGRVVVVAGPHERALAGSPINPTAISVAKMATEVGWRQSNPRWHPRFRHRREAKMNLKKMLCVAAVVVLVILAASYTRVQALSLVNPTSGWTFYENVTTQIQWRRNYWRRRHWRHHGGRHPFWGRRHWQPR